MSSSLTNWYFRGTTLHPTPEYLRTHVTSLAKNHTSSTLTLAFADHQTITLSHAQLSLSPLPYLAPFTHLKLETSSEPYHKIRDFLYCTPVDLSNPTLPLINAARKWHLRELYHACFFVAETAGCGIVQLVERYIPLVTFDGVPHRFQQFLAARVAVEAETVMAWFDSASENGETTSNKDRFLGMLNKVQMQWRVREALRMHADIYDVVDIVPGEWDTSVREVDLSWELPLGELLCSEKEYVECDVSTDGASGYVELTWDRQGVRLILGLQEVDGNDLAKIVCCAIGMGCACGDFRHNVGWELEGGAEDRSVAWAVTHEVEFRMFDAAGLREWREAHKDCSVRVKIRVLVMRDGASSDSNGDTDMGGSATEEEEQPSCASDSRE